MNPGARHLHPVMNQLPRRINSGRRLLAGLVDLIYPPVCLHCAAPLEAGTPDAFCPGCFQQLQALLGDACPRCAAPVARLTIVDDQCRYCKDESYTFTKSIAWGGYQSLLRALILRMKHATGEPVAFHLATLLAEQFRPELTGWAVDAVVPVPLHWSRRLWRGYNQAAAVAEVVARRLGKPYRPRWLWRRRQTPPQATVTPEERRRNLRGAFAARIPPAVKGGLVLLVDDVMTTGSTADGCARALLAAGAREVRVAVLTRAVGESATASPPPMP